MKPLKILFISDTHLGLRVDNYDMTEDIEAVIMTAVNKAVELKEEGYEVLLIFGGDVFDNNNPNEAHIGALIRVLGVIKENEIITYFMVGNHEARANPYRLSCLSFIKEATIGYPTVKLIENIHYMDYGTSVSGRLHLTFLPHISKALIERKEYDGSPQDYINDKCQKILNKVHKNVGDHIVFSHLNVMGAHPGSESNLLNRSDVYLPKCFTSEFLVGVKPTIIQAHLHSRQQIDNIHIVGSPIFCSFNEHGEKGFAVITVGRQFGDKWDIEYFPSNAPEFIAMEIDLMNKSEDFFSINEVKEMIAQIPTNLKSVIKVEATINPEHNSYDWNGITEKLKQMFPLSIVKQINPRIIPKRTVRNSEQKISLTKDESVRTFIKSNWKHDKELARSIYKTAKTYIGAN